MQIVIKKSNAKFIGVTIIATCLSLLAGVAATLCGAENVSWMTISMYFGVIVGLYI